MNIRDALRVSLAVTALSLALTSSAQAATPVHVSCGDTITTDTTLANDLTDCHGNGLNIGADNITLDLNGHTIDGDDDGFDSCVDRCDEAVDNRAGHDDVTVKNGTVTQFVDGIVSLGGARMVVTGIVSTGQAHAGVFLLRAPGSRVEGNRSVDDGALVLVARSSDLRIVGNTVSGNEFTGIGLAAADHVLISGNTVSDSNESAISLGVGSDHNRVENNTLSDGRDGVDIESGGDHNVIAGNHVTGMRLQAIRVDTGAHENEVSNNTAIDNVDGFVIGGDRNTISGNIVERALGAPGDPIAGMGIIVDGGNRNLIQDNQITATATHGIRVTTFRAGAAVGNVLRSNRVQGAAAGGYLIDPKVVGTVLAANLARDTGADGFNILNRATTLTANTAISNAKLGIRAVAGVTDGGGNRAFGNGDPLQCTNVICSSG